MIHLQPWLGERSPDLLARLFRQLCVAFHHEREHLLVEPMQDIQQPEARLADKTDAQRDVGEKRHQRGLEAVGQNDGLVIVQLA